MGQIKQHSFRVIESDESLPADETAAADHVGVYLREARMAIGRNLADIAASLNIRVRFLQAIEDGRYEDLPGYTYAIGFVRSYADYLELDTEALLARFKDESNTVEDNIDLTFPAPAPAGWSPTGKLVTTCVVLAASLFGGWYYLQTKDAVDVAAVPVPPGHNVAVAAEADASVAKRTGAIASPATSSGEDLNDPYSLPVPIATLVTADPLAATADDAAAANHDEDNTPSSASAAPAAPVVAAETAPEHAESQSPQAANHEEVASDGTEPPSAPAPAASVAPPDETAAAKPIEPQPVEEKPTVAKQVEPKPVAAKPVEVASVEAKPIVVQPSAPQPIKPKSTATIVRAPAPQSAAPQPPVQIASMSATGALGDSLGANGGGRTFGVTNRHARVVIGARAESWVQVLDGNQNVLLTRMLRPGDRYLVPDRDDLVMLTGNAGGLTITVDGKEVPRIGSDGAILHNVRLNVDLLKAGRAVIQ